MKQIINNLVSPFISNFHVKCHFVFFYLQSEVFDEIDLSDLCTAECSIKNINHSFQVSSLNTIEYEYEINNI